MADPEKKDEKKKQLVSVSVNRASQIQIQVDRSRVLFLQPGGNLVDATMWGDAKKIEQIKTLLRTKLLPAVAPEESPEKVGHFILVEGKTVDADNPLVGMSEDEALLFVSETFQVPLLKKLLEQGSAALGANIQRALRAQIEKIEKPKQDAKRAA